MEFRLDRTLFLLIFLIGTLFGSAAAQETKSSPNNAKQRPVRAEAVTINIPEGMTKEQADAILNELRQIRRLLEKQQQVGTAAAAQPPTAPALPDTVKMKMNSRWYSLGQRDAPVTLVEFTDYQCPFCKHFHAESFAELKKNYIDTGKLRFISLDLPLEFHPYALKAALAARCAGEQGKFWEMRDTLISNSADLGPEAILKYAQSLPLEMAGFRNCLSTEKYKPEVQRDVADANSLGISGTPTFVLGKSLGEAIEGVRIVGVVPYEIFDSQIKKLLAD